MPRVKKQTSDTDIPKRRKAITPENRENQMINYAINLAEKQLREGTASSQVITHYLKLGTQQSKLELEKTKLEIKLTEAKAEAIKSQKRSEELFKKAIKAMRRYRGESDDSDFESEDQDL